MNAPICPTYHRYFRILSGSTASHAAPCISCRSFVESPNSVSDASWSTVCSTDGVVICCIRRTNTTGAYARNGADPAPPTRAAWRLYSRNCTTRSYTSSYLRLLSEMSCEMRCESSSLAYSSCSPEPAAPLDANVPTSPAVNSAIAGDTSPPTLAAMMASNSVAGPRFVTQSYRCAGHRSGSRTRLLPAPTRSFRSWCSRMKAFLPSIAVRLISGSSW